MALRIVVAVGIMMVALDASVRSRDLDFGQTEYLSKCAACHGADGKGAGPLSATIKPKPADLTILAKRNNGDFAASIIYKKIDGREARTSHGSTEMPIWGCRHLSPTVLQRKGRARTATQHGSLRKVTKPAADPFASLIDRPCDPEPVIQSRIQAIVEYLRQIQEK
jgi:hypothetical protein